jgi:hypothetical protein
MPHLAVRPAGRQNPEENPKRGDGNGVFVLVRGVWLAPWFGPGGQVVLVAIASEHRKLAELVVLIGGDHVQATDGLWESLDVEAPVPSGAALGASPRFRAPRRALHLYVSR